MLINLHVRNLALIEEADIDFHDHLNILTGETGAGKSILIGSIQSALGSKIPKDMIRTGCESASIELIFHSQSQAVKEKLEEYDIPFEDGEVILTRRISSQRVINKVNDCSITVSRLKELAPLLLDLSGQHDNQLLLRPANHMEILDSYDKESIFPLKKEVAGLYQKYKDISSRLDQESMDEEERQREMEFLQYQIREIRGANLQPHEDEDLEAQYQKISHAKEILALCASAYRMTGEGNQNASNMVGYAFRDLMDAAAYDDGISFLTDQLGTIDALLGDFNRELASYMASMEFDEQTFHDLEERLDQINHLKAKYGGSLDKINAYLEKSLESYERLSNYQEYLDSLIGEKNRLRQLLAEACDKLTGLRKTAAGPLSDKIRDALLDLNFMDVRFHIDIRPKEEAGPDGRDQVCFLISTNPGMAMGPLQDIASGGELSRIMLAIKSILADEEKIETLIFDEIDAGISGRTAQKVSERLKKIARGRQVIAITHLPQIAAMADSHYLIEKSSDRNTTISNICLLDQEASVRELARMLGGAKITETVLENAREMKEFASAFADQSDLS